MVVRWLSLKLVNMTKNDFQKLSRIRLKEARVLLSNGFFEGSYYLAGYAVECAIKACIAKNVKKYDFPDKELAINSYSHDLQKLIKLAGLQNELDVLLKSNKKFELNWTLVKDWTEQKRYSTAIPDILAKELYSALTSRQNGVMIWLRSNW